MKVDGWTLQNGKLQKVWRWTNERAPFNYQGQGQHSIKVGDIDGDGADEILNGSIAIDNDGRRSPARDPLTRLDLEVDRSRDRPHGGECAARCGSRG
jgi:hypothetical protein